MSGAREIEFSDNTVGAEEIAAVTGVLKSRWLSAGPVTRQFERTFADAIGAADAVAVSSGTAALHVALAALGIGPGDEVITPALTFVAGAAMTVLLGATPVFADVCSPDDLNVDPGAVPSLVTDRTKAVIVTHYGGFAADLVQVHAVAEEHGIALVEDAAHAPQVRTGQGMLGTVGDAGCFSFYATKNATMGEGGIVVARDPDRLAACRAMRSHFMTAPSRDRSEQGAASYDIIGPGMNYRPTDVTAAIGLVQLGRLAADRERRRMLTARYRGMLAGLPGLTVPFAQRDLAAEDSAFHLLAVVLPEAVDRTAVREKLRQHGVPTSVHYPPTHWFSFYSGRRPTAHVPVTDRLAGRLLSLPLHARMTEDDVDHVVAALRTALAATGRMEPGG